MPAHKLILLPSDPHVALDQCDQLATTLLEIGLIGEPRRSNAGLFYPTGDHFLQLVSFLGCSPMIELDPPAIEAKLDSAIEDGRFCHITLDCHPLTQFRSDPQTRPPRCPHCGQAVTDWTLHLNSWQENPAKTGWACPACEQTSEITRWAFRKTAGFGKVFVEIRGIYPSEAVPCETLLARLQSLTSSPWHYIYIKE